METKTILTGEERDRLESFFSELKTFSNNRYWVVEKPEDLISEFEDLLEKKMEDFAEFCHEHYRGSVTEPNGEYLYQYDSEVVWLLDQYFSINLSLISSF